MRKIGFACALGILLAGCSDPKAPTKGNFSAAIDKWGAENPACLSILGSGLTPADAGAQKRDGAFPLYLDDTPPTTKFATENRQRERAPFEALVGAGLLKASQAKIAIKPSPLNSLGGEAHPIMDPIMEVRAYDLTEAGAKAYKKDTRSSFDKGGFCYGAPSVDEVVQFTEPSAAMMGMQISLVHYAYHLKDVPDWAKNEALRAAFPQLARDTAPKLEGRTEVVLMNDGWQDARMIRR